MFYQWQTSRSYQIKVIIFLLLKTKVCTIVFDVITSVFVLLLCFFLSTFSLTEG